MEGGGNTVNGRNVQLHVELGNRKEFLPAIALLQQMAVMTANLMEEFVLKRDHVTNHLAQVCNYRIKEKLRAYLMSVMNIAITISYTIDIL